MTTYCAIIRDGDTYFGCDKKIVAGNEIIHAPDTYKKYALISETVIAFPGSPTYLQSFLRFMTDTTFVDPKDVMEVHILFCEFQAFLKEACFYVPEEEMGFESMDCEVLLVNTHGIFSIYERREVVSHSQFFASGSGKDFALGAIQSLWSTQCTAEIILRKAIEVTSNLDIYTGDQIDILKIS